ncbi:MAG: hypothetical protein Q9221_007018 [Calogaya cf. arnoldii]
MSQEPPIEYSGHKVLVFTAVFIPIQVICVALRYLSRYLKKGSWGFDDVLILASLFFQIILGILCICSVHYAGVGYHVAHLQTIRPDPDIVWRKYLTAVSLVYFWTVSIPRIAFLVLYYRLFPDQKLRRVVIVLIGLLIALTLAPGIAKFAACRPFAANWDEQIPGAKCIDKVNLFLWANFPNILTDVMILLLPMPTIWNLQAPLRLKISLVAIFAVGSLGLAGAIARFVIFFEKGETGTTVDGTWAAVDIIIWAQLETGMYLISACLMSYRPILERIAHMSMFSKIWSISGLRRSSDKGGFQQHNPDGAMQPRTQQGRTGFLPLNDIHCEDSQIVVTTDIEVAHKGHQKDFWKGSEGCNVV